MWKDAHLLSLKLPAAFGHFEQSLRLAQPHLKGALAAARRR